MTHYTHTPVPGSDRLRTILPAARPDATLNHQRHHALAERDGGWRCWHCAGALADPCYLLTKLRGEELLLDVPPGQSTPCTYRLTRVGRGGTDDLSNLVLSCRKCTDNRVARERATGVTS